MGSLDIHYRKIDNSKHRLENFFKFRHHMCRIPKFTFVALFQPPGQRPSSDIHCSAMLLISSILSHHLAQFLKFALTNFSSVLDHIIGNSYTL